MSVHPGMVFTGMTMAPFKGESFSMRLVRVCIELYYSLILRSAREAAKIVLAAAVAGQGSEAGARGAYYDGLANEVPDAIMPAVAKSAKAAGRLWEASEHHVSSIVKTAEA